ncbi:Flagellar hook protein FlgE [Alkalibacterium sp. AK22]|uniref:flagellar hook-basal body complex protein n=1 Tax=Alkalibacterium sp. AK22 TaxID=1229520 RepID=UPI00044E619F|nr:flagellar hook-basal body complex protein [Alkalibacterium sp. AK22]EXJ22389.1 Flagellar hook protein FlgE [Alkalibacterium sp. AK22]
MLNSLYSGITGMKGQQTKMDVIANNISNVNTTGYKSQRVRFQDMISQMNANAQGANNNGRGGINAQQVGLGTQVATTDVMMGGGSLQFTGRNLDFGIQNGDNSFFVVSESGNAGEPMQYTRDGGFYTDTNGNLTTSNGFRVMGYSAGTPANVNGFNAANLTGQAVGPLSIPETIPNPAGGGVLTIQDYSIDNTGTILGTYSNGEAYVLGRIALSNFANPDGLEKVGDNMYNSSANSGQPTYGGPSDDGFGTIRSGFMEMSNVDLATEFTEMIVASRAYQANSRSITTSDEMLQELINLKR